MPAVNSVVCVFFKVSLPLKIVEASKWQIGAYSLTKSQINDTTKKADDNNASLHLFYLIFYALQSAEAALHLKLQSASPQRPQTQLPHAS